MRRAAEPATVARASAKFGNDDRWQSQEKPSKAGGNQKTLASRDPPRLTHVVMAYRRVGRYRTKRGSRRGPVHNSHARAGRACQMSSRNTMSHLGSNCPSGHARRRRKKPSTAPHQGAASELPLGNLGYRGCQPRLRTTGCGRSRPLRQLGGTSNYGIGSWPVAFAAATRRPTEYAQDARCSTRGPSAAAGGWRISPQGGLHGCKPVWRLGRMPCRQTPEPDRGLSGQGCPESE